MDDLLKEAKLTKTKLAEMLGLHLATVVGWKGDAPKYALLVLKQYIELREYRQLKIVLKRALS